MKAKQFVLILVTLVIGAVLAVLVLRQPAGKSQNLHDHDHGHGHDHGDSHAGHEDEEYERGPHGGRLLGTDGLELEVLLFEQAGIAEFRIYPYVKDQAVPPDQLKVSVELKRMGGRRETISFAPSGEHQRGQVAVAEPHSFDVTVHAEFQGKKAEWTYASYEGRTKIQAALAAASGVKTDVAGPATLRKFRDLPAHVRLNEDLMAHAVSRFKGQVTAVHKNLGDVVKAGEVLAVLDSRDLADAKADFIEALHKLELAQTVFSREETLWKKKISPEQDYLAARHELEETEIRKQTTRQKLLSLGLQEPELAALSVEPSGTVVPFQPRQPFAAQALTRYEVRAPVDGTVVRKSVALGSPVSEDAELFLIADISRVWVDAAVPAAELAAVRTGQRVIVTGGARQVEGAVVYVGPGVDAETRAGFLRVVLPNQGVWKPGEFVTVKLLQLEEGVPVAVRPDALQTMPTGTVLFLNEGEQYEAQPVELGRRTEEWVEVLSGLKAGQRYVSGNSFLIKADILKSGASHDH